MELGDNIYNDYQNDPRKAYLKRYQLQGMENSADFYGKQADDMGRRAEVTEASIAPQAEVETSSAGSSFDAKSAGVAAVKADNGQDMVSSGLMASGNPYAMGAGAALKVASMGQQREQKKLDAHRAAYIDRQNKIREATDKILDMDFGV